MISNSRADIQLLQAVLDMSQSLKRIEGHLDDIASKMPFEEQDLAAQVAELSAELSAGYTKLTSKPPAQVAHPKGIDSGEEHGLNG